MLTRAEIDGFKSFSEFDIAFEDVNVLLGPNGSGKSNLGQALGLVRDVCAGADVETALGKLGGFPLAARSGGKGGTATIDVTLSFDLSDGAHRRATLPSPDPREEPDRCPAAIYHLQLGVLDGAPMVTRESLRARFARPGPKQMQLGGNEPDDFEIVFERTPTTRELKDRTVDPGLAKSLSGEISKADRTSPFLRTAGRFVSGTSIAVLSEIEGWRFYDIDPTSAIRRGARIEQSSSLTENGSNVAAVLGELMQGRTPEAKGISRALGSALKRNVPGYTSVGTKKGSDGAAELYITEEGVQQPLPPQCLSTGTLKLVMLYLAALWHPSPATLLFLEEPTRGLHPVLFQEIYDILVANRHRTQVISTTHSEGFVDHFEAGEVILFDKDSRGTSARRASSGRDIPRFLENWSLGEAWVHGELGGVPR